MSDVLSRVPLIAQVPGGASGHVVRGPVQTADILETMLDMANLNPEFVRFGQSLVPQVYNVNKHILRLCPCLSAGYIALCYFALSLSLAQNLVPPHAACHVSQLHAQADDLERTVYSEGGFYFQNEQMIEAQECLSGGPKADYYPRGEEEAQPNGSPRAVMLRTLSHKLVYRPTGVSELYDLKSDPLELTNVFASSQYSDLRTEMMTNLTRWIVLTSDVTPTVVDSRGPPKYPYPINEECVLQPLEGDFSDVKVTDYLTINGVW